MRQGLRRSGFTLIEVIVATVLGAMIITAAFALSGAAGRQTRQLRAIGAVSSQGLEIDATLANDVRLAGFGIVSFPNIGPLQIQLDADTTNGTDDQLTLLVPTTTAPPVLPLSTEPCKRPPPGGTTCVRMLVTAGTEFPDTVGAVVLVGSSVLGGQLAVVTGVSSPLSGSAENELCGSDCGLAAPLIWNTSSFPAIPADTRYSTIANNQCVPLGGTVADTQPCTVSLIAQKTVVDQRQDTTANAAACAVSRQRVLPTGIVCGDAMHPITGAFVPQRAIANVPGAAAPTRTSRYAEVTLRAIGGTFGYPESPMAVYRSGPNRLPLAVIQPVSIVRYRIQRDTTVVRRPTLMRESLWSTAENRFIIQAPVVMNIDNFRVSHRVGPLLQSGLTQIALVNAGEDIGTYRRRPIATSLMLSVVNDTTGTPQTNCILALAGDTISGFRNRVVERTPADNSAPLAGWQYCRSYQTLSAIRVQYRVEAAWRNENTGQTETQRRTYSTTLATENPRSGATLTPP